MPLLPLAASPPVSRSPRARQETSYDGKDAWRSRRSDRDFFLAECVLASVSRRGGGQGPAEEEEEETAEPNAYSQRSRPWMLEVIGKLR